MPGFADFAGFAGVVEITRFNTSEFYYLINCTVMDMCSYSVLSLQTTPDVETTEQFILLHKRPVCAFFWFD